MDLLPPFPVDDATLDMLLAAIDPRSHGQPDAEQSNVLDFLQFMSQMGGSETHAINEELTTDVTALRDPQYDRDDVIVALVAEVRRLRGVAGGECD